MGRASSSSEEENDDGEESEEESGDGETDDHVGYVEKPPSKNEARLLTRRMFPSKLGGRPAWLVPQNLPPMPNALPSSPCPPADPAALQCRSCGRPLRFLMQIYASRGEERPDAFHRALHLFVCTSCQPNEARLFRAQLPRENEFYSSEAPNAKAVAANLRKKGDKDPVLDRFCCVGCGLPRDSDDTASCQECARRQRNGEGPAVFQERELTTTEADMPEEPEELEGQEGDSAQDAASAIGEAAAVANDSEEVEEVFTEGAAKARGPDRDLVAEAEGVLDAAKRKGASQAVLEKLEEYKAKAAESADHVLDGSEQKVFEEYSKEKGEKDEVFSRFNRFAAVNNGHVLRYNFGGQPLWFATPGRMEDEPPPCQNCGGPRVFEFQVQPQLIGLLSGTTDVADRLDFGTICCFVCKGSCSAPAMQPYLEEFAFVQGEPHDAWLPRA